MLNKVRNTIKKYNMLNNYDKVLLALSGGTDSLSMMHIMLALKDEYKIKLIAAHVDHGTRRGQSTKDAEFVNEICSQLGIRFHVKTFNLIEYAADNRMSHEQAGRLVRYEFFKQLCNEFGYDKIAVAHNLNDNAETVVMRFVRGSGLEGLTGIKPVRGNKIIRPLIEVARDEIEQYCKNHNLNPRHDITNCQPIYTRNRIRLELIPLLKRDYNQNIIQTLDRTASILNEDNDYLEEVSSKVFDKIHKIDGNIITMEIKDLLKLHKSIQRRVVRRAVYNVKSGLNDFEYKHMNNILDMVHKGVSGNSLNIKGGVNASISFGNLQIYNKGTLEQTKDFEYILHIPGDTIIKETGGTITGKLVQKNHACDLRHDRYTALFDYSKLEKSNMCAEIRIRNRREGDLFCPYGMKGSKKLKKYMIEKKVPVYKRSSIPLAVKNDEIIWVVGIGYSNKYTVDRSTDMILILQYHINTDR